MAGVKVPVVGELELLGRLELGTCPACGGRIPWSKPRRIGVLWGGVAVGAGYWAIPPPAR